MENDHINKSKHNKKLSKLSNTYELTTKSLLPNKKHKELLIEKAFSNENKKKSSSFKVIYIITELLYIIYIIFLLYESTSIYKSSLLSGNSFFTYYIIIISSCSISVFIDILLAIFMSFIYKKHDFSYKKLKKLGKNLVFYKKFFFFMVIFYSYYIYYQVTIINTSNSKDLSVNLCLSYTFSSLFNCFFQLVGLVFYSTSSKSSLGLAVFSSFLYVIPYIISLVFIIKNSFFNETTDNPYASSQITLLYLIYIHVSMIIFIIISNILGFTISKYINKLKSINSKQKKGNFTIINYFKSIIDLNKQVIIDVNQSTNEILGFFSSETYQDNEEYDENTYNFSSFIRKSLKFNSFPYGKLVDFYNKKTFLYEKIQEYDMSNLDFSNNMHIPHIGTFIDNSQSNEYKIYEVYIKTLSSIYENINIDYLSSVSEPVSDSIIEIILIDISSQSTCSILKNESTQKDSYFAKLAHELKTPLICMSTLSESLKMILETKKFPEALKLSDEIQKLSEFTFFLIDDIMQITNKEEKKDSIGIQLEVKTIEEDLLFVYDILQILLTMKNKKQINHDLIISDVTIKSTVRIDSLRLRQILINLISNAVKFTKTGYIEINTDVIVNEISPNGMNLVNGMQNDVSQTEKTENNIEKKEGIHIKIKDSGIGVKPELAEKLFKNERVIDVGVNNTINHIGTGEGLNIVKRLCDLMGLSISFKSELNVGSEFEIVIPFVSVYKENLDVINEIDEMDVQDEHVKERINVTSKSNKETGPDLESSYESEESSYDSDGSNVDITSRKKNFNSHKSQKVVKSILNQSKRREVKSQKSAPNLQTIQIDMNQIMNLSNTTSLNDTLILNPTEIITDPYDHLSTKNLIQSPMTFIKQADWSHSSLSKSSSKKVISFKSSLNVRPIEERYKVSTISSEISDINRISTSNPLFKNKYSAVGRMSIMSNISNLMRGCSKKYSVRKSISINNDTKSSKILYEYRPFTGISNFHKLDSNKQDDILKPVIIICDDYEMIRNSSRNMMKSVDFIEKRFNIECCYDGIEVLYKVIEDQLKGNLIKVLFIDENMEYMNGSQTVIIIKNLIEKQKVRNIHCVLLSANKESQLRCFDYVLVKPINRKMINECFAVLNIIDESG